MSCAERKDGSEVAGPARERLLDCLRESLLLPRPRPISRDRRVAARAFHNQDVDLVLVRLGLRKNRRLRDRLIIEVHVAGVKQGATFSANKNSGGTENVS